jgi:hypothetical protein
LRYFEKVGFLARSGYRPPNFSIEYIWPEKMTAPVIYSIRKRRQKVPKARYDCKLLSHPAQLEGLAEVTAVAFWKWIGGYSSFQACRTMNEPHHGGDHNDNLEAMVLQDMVGDFQML